MATSKISGLFGVILAVFSLFFASCEKEPINQNENYPEVVNNEGVFVLNEGNFQFANSSVSYYHKNTGEIWHDLFLEINGETPGDILQSGILHDGLLWLVVNNSGKIEAINPVTGERQKTINGFTSPRYMLPWNESKAYVSDLFANKVFIVDLVNQEITGEILINDWTEALLKTNDKLLVSAMAKKMIFSIDPQTEQITDSLNTGAGPGSMVMDKQGMVWVLCGGDYMDNSDSKLIRIDPVEWKVIEEYEMPVEDATFSRLKINAEGNILYFLGPDVYTFNINDPQSGIRSLIQGEGMTFYGLGTDPVNGDIYVSDAIDYTQQGKVMRYNKLGELLDEFSARIIPGDFIFY